MLFRSDEKEKEYQKNNEELTQELQDLSVSLSQNYESLVAEKRKVDDFSREIKYYRQENYKLKLKIEQLNKSLDDKDLKLQSLDKKLKKAQDEKDYLNQQVDDIELAKIQAQGYIDQAKIQAKQIVQHADIQAAQKRMQFKQESQELANSAALYKANINNIEAHLEESFVTLKKIISDMERSTQLMQSNFESYSSGSPVVNSYETAQIHSIENQRNQIEKTQEIILKPKVKVEVKQSKKNLAESILDSLSKLIEK